MQCVSKVLNSLLLSLIASLTLHANPAKSIVLGRIENVKIMDFNKHLPAKLDSGATLTSLSANKIHIITQQQQKWVRFQLEEDASKVYSKPLVRITSILNRNGERSDLKKYTLRPVIYLTLCIGGVKKQVEVNLVNRQQFRYKLLLGRVAIGKFNALIAVRKTFLSNNKDCL